MTSTEDSVAAKRLRARVSSTRTVTGGITSKEEYVLYIMEVSCSGRTWTVPRRYSEFRRLHSKCHSSSRLPGRRILGSSTEPAFVAQRSKELQEMLQSMLAESSFAVQDGLREFLLVDEMTVRVPEEPLKPGTAERIPLGASSTAHERASDATAANPAAHAGASDKLKELEDTKIALEERTAGQTYEIQRLASAVRRAADDLDA